MSAPLENIINFLLGEKIFPAVISATTTVIVFFITLFTKRYFDTRILSSKIQTEYKFEQRKKIKEVLAKHKVQLLTACEDLNHRLWNFTTNHNKSWIVADGNYKDENYYFHSTIYRILCVFAWIKKINSDMIFLDTTIASKEDLDFIKFLKLFPSIFCDLSFLVGEDADGSLAVDHFFKTKFELLPNAIINNEQIESYADFKDKLSTIHVQIKDLCEYIDSISPNESRARWDRLNLMHLTLITFLNCYGYDFQNTNDIKIKKALTKPRTSILLNNYFKLIKEYHLENNQQIKKLQKLSKSVISHSENK